MSQRVLRVHPDVLSVDVPATTAYYDEIDPKLGDRFSQLIVDATHQIEAHPWYSPNTPPASAAWS